MTNEDLIIGHYDKSLTSEQERMLQERISQSVETRAMYEQYGKFGNLDAALAADAAAVTPSSRLDEATVVAALSVLPEVIGGAGAFAWLSGKVAIMITAVVVGGTTIAILSNSGSDPAPKPAPKPAPVVRQSAPASAPAVAPSVQTPTPAPTHPSVDAAKASSGDANAGTASVRESSPRRVTDASATSRTSAGRKATKPGKLGIDKSNPPTIENGTKLH